MVRDERECSGFEESDAAASSSARTGRADDARREGEGLQGNHREARAFHGPVQGGARARHHLRHRVGGVNIVGPKVLSKATTELLEGLVAKVGGTGGIDFDAIAGIIAATLVLYLVSAACSFVQGG